jgi:hypothetical protein
MPWIDPQSGETMTQRLKQNLVNAFSYCLFAGVLFFVWNDPRFHHWYLVPFVLISLIVKAIWWHRQARPFAPSAWRKLIWPAPR